MSCRVYFKLNNKTLYPKLCIMLNMLVKQSKSMCVVSGWKLFESRNILNYLCTKPMQYNKLLILLYEWNMHDMCDKVPHL